MRHLDYYWMSNENWYHMNKNCVYVLSDDAPPEAKESYEHFLEQERNHKSVFDDDSIRGFAPSFNVAKGSVSCLRNQLGTQSPTDSENGTRRR